MNLKALAAKYLALVLTNTQAREEFAHHKSDLDAVAGLLKKYLEIKEPLSADTVIAMFQQVEELKKPLLDAIQEHASEHYEAVQAASVLGFTRK